MESQSAAKHYKYSKLDDKLIGKTFNNIQILSFSHVKNSRRYYNIKCLNCNNISDMRSDRFLGTQKLNTCSICRQTNAISQSKQRASPDTVYKTLYAHYRQGSLSRNFIFSITLEQFKNIITKNCHYCGSEPVVTNSSKRINKTDIPVKNNGVDRINNSLGYILENCVPCCKICNIMKNNHSSENFLNHIKKIYIYNEGSTTIP